MLQRPASDYLPSFRVAIEWLPESSIVALALSQPSLLGLTQEQSARLQPLVAKRYSLISGSPCYSNAPSAVPYCFSAQRPTNGFASVYVPENATADTPVILFIHGYGGSFLWYQHYLSDSFSNHIIICPAYGISADTIPQAYVTECLTAVSRRVGFRVSAPHLLGLSAGGFGVCRLYVAAPQYYRQMICLGAYPTDDTLSRFARDSRPRFLSGELEPYVVSGDFQRRIGRIRGSCPTVEMATIPGADHFFLLTHPKGTIEHLNRWLSTVQINKDNAVNGGQQIGSGTNGISSATGSYR